MTDTEAVDGFNATLQHALALWEKAEMLREQAKQAADVARSLVPRVDDATLEAGYRALKAADLPGRRGMYEEINRRRRTRSTHQPGDIIRRERGSFERWPVADAWVYILLTEDADVLYVGKTVRPKGRLSAHARRIPWRYVDLIACKDEAAALALEGDLIYQHRPRWNRQGTQARRTAA